MLSPRQRRLTADAAAMRGEFAGHPHVSVEPLGALPAEHYRVTFRVPGLALDGDQPVVVDEHIVDVRLPLGYPRDQPLVTPLTPVFHPNVDATYCVGDYWSAGQPLADIVKTVGNMLQYRTFNVKSPLNAVAARWASENMERFPIGNTELGAHDFEVTIRRREPPTTAPTDPSDDQEVGLARRTPGGSN